MSNFSQYFPASSGGGSGGTPINGYTPFLVSATGNPTGYDSATGLYTHPDGTFWLKTGNTIADTTSAYPSATKTGNSIYSGTSYNNAIANWDITHDGTDFWVVSLTTNQVYQYDSSFSLLSQFAIASNSTGITWNGTNLFVNDIGGSVREYTTAGVLANTFTLSGGVGSTYQAIAYDTSLSQFWLSSQGSGNKVELYDTSFNYVGTTFTTTVTPVGVTVDTQENGIWVLSQTSLTVTFYSKTGVVGTNFSVAAQGGNPAGIMYVNGDIYQANRGNNSIFIYSQPVGDATARTDTDSAQPLFTRIG